MAKSKIFVRENGSGRYRYGVVAVQGGDIHFYQNRLSKAELEAIAREMDAELVSIKAEEDIEIDEGEQGTEGGGEEYEDVE